MTGAKEVIEFQGSASNTSRVLPNKEGTRLYALNNLPRPDLGQKAATVATYDLSGEHAEHLIEVGLIELPMPGESLRNDRKFDHPGSTAFQCALDLEETALYVICQRINQTEENKTEEGNILHSLKLDENGVPSTIQSRQLGQDGIHFQSRPQGVATINK